ncbi:DUF550 domain-containing protein [Enterobacter roggenkampii]|uniref:DUF550 domain-containing protein n=1 Tax=Enterobacter roggenkampii TaxID=1812935 RepID=UPI00214ADF53|nr:DUF550 domain-containing protein [Enterobacter roggenkampii]
MSTITRERAQEIFLGNGPEPTASEERELARIALASLEAEPVAWLLSGGGAKNNVSFDSGNAYADPLREVTPLYTAPPAPVSVPAAMEMDDDFDSAFEHGKAVGWNAYRAAMLQGSQPVSKREQVRREHAEWSDKTFGDVGPVGPLKHLSKEALEAAAEPDDLSEWADMQFLLWDAQRRAGISDGEITAAMEEKLKVNMARQWPEPKDGEPRQHLKPAPQTVPDSVISAAVNGIMATYADNAEDCREMIRTHVEQACRAAIQESGHG